jgi:hypothetical protein
MNGWNGYTYSTASILRPIKFARSRPAFFNPCFHQRAEDFVERVSGPVVAVEPLFQIFAWRPVEEND